MKLSVLLPSPQIDDETYKAYSRLVSNGPAERLWQGQTSAADPMHGFIGAVGRTAPVPTGIGVTLMPLRHPFEAAIQARSLARITGTSAVIGYGPGGRSFQQAMRGSAYQSPLRATREYVSTVSSLLAGETVDVHGDYVTCTGALPPAGLHPPIEVGVGVLRAGMARVAGECADTAITWMTPPGYIEQVLLPELHASARAAGKKPPRLVAMIPVALQGQDFDAAQLVLASNGAHLRREHYLSMLAAAGLEISKHNSRANALELVASGGFLYGSLNAVRQGLEKFASIGVDEVVLNVTGSARLRGVEHARRELEEVVGGSSHAAVSEEREYSR